ncbi:MAG TPA: ThuA domain-containing protein [Casimicrobiaceae bacterium]|jgi:hypothetical protein
MTTHLLRAALAAAAFSFAMIAGNALASPGEPTVPEPTNGNAPPGTKDDFDVTYNVCRGTDPRCYHPWTQDRQNKVLLYTRTAGPRHANLGPALGPGLNPPLAATNVVQNAIIKWMGEQGVAVDYTEDVGAFASAVGVTSRYKAVIFISTSRDALWKHGTAVDPVQATNTTTGAHLDAGRTALRQYLRAGGGFVGIHNAFGTEYNWPYYEGLLGNANFYDHGPFQEGDVETVAKHDSSTDGLPARWHFKDEWYNLVPYPTNVKFLLTVDEASLPNGAAATHPGHGKFHPVAWCQYYDGGRAWLTTLGHDTNAFTDGSGSPGQAQFKSLIVNGILSAMGNLPFCGS